MQAFVYSLLFSFVLNLVMIALMALAVALGIRLWKHMAPAKRRRARSAYAEPKADDAFTRFGPI